MVWREQGTLRGAKGEPGVVVSRTKPTNGEVWVDPTGSPTGVNTRPALHKGEGSEPSEEYMEIHDVRVGDFWLDKTTMILHEVTEV